MNTNYNLITTCYEYGLSQKKIISILKIKKDRLNRIEVGNEEFAENEQNALRNILEGIKLCDLSSDIVRSLSTKDLRTISQLGKISKRNNLLESFGRVESKFNDNYDHLDQPNPSDVDDDDDDKAFRNFHLPPIDDDETLFIRESKKPRVMGDLYPDTFDDSSDDDLDDCDDDFIPLGYDQGNSSINYDDFEDGDDFIKACDNAIPNPKKKESFSEPEVTLSEDIEPPKRIEFLDAHKISFETIRFITILDKLRQDAKYGILPFSEYNDIEALYYDDDINSENFGEVICEIGYDRTTQQFTIEKYWKDVCLGLKFYAYIDKTGPDEWTEIGISYADDPDCEILCSIVEGFSF